MADALWSRLGGIGIAALMLKYALLLALPGSSRLGALLPAGGLSRATIVWVCWRFPYAEIDTGIGGWFTALAGARDRRGPAPDARRRCSH